MSNSNNDHADGAPAKPPQPVSQIAKLIPLMRPATLRQTNVVAEIGEGFHFDLAEATRQRRKGFLLRLSLFVGLPTLLATLYVCFYATPRYVSEFQVTYGNYAQPQAAGSAGAGLLANIMGGGAGGATIDMSRIIASYMVSSDILARVDQQLDLRAAFSSPGIDWLDRLSPHASQEDFLDYFRHRVSVDAIMGGYVVVDVEAFDPKTAAAIATSMLAAADHMVSALSERARQDQVHLAEQELQTTQVRLVKATVAVTTFRNTHRNFNPDTAAGQLDSVVGNMEAQAAQTRSELASARSFIDENSPTVEALKSKIRGIEGQIDAQRNRLTATQNDGKTNSTMPYSKLVADYTTVQLEMQFAKDSYLSAKQAFDTARNDAARKASYVESIVPPNLPGMATSPSPMTVIPTVFIVSLLAYGIGSLLIGAFRDQAGI